MVNWQEHICNAVETPHYGYEGGPVEHPYVRGVIVHSTQGGQELGVEYQATINWFLSPGSKVSAWACIAYFGCVATFGPIERVYWHAGSYEYNIGWIGIELEGPFVNSHYSDLQYRLLASMIVAAHAQYGFPLDRDHIKGHNEVSAVKSDPGPNFDWGRLMTEMALIVSPPPPEPLPQPPPVVLPGGTSAGALLLAGMMMLLGAAGALLLRED